MLKPTYDELVGQLRECAAMMEVRSGGPCDADTIASVNVMLGRIRTCDQCIHSVRVGKKSNIDCGFFSKIDPVPGWFSTVYRPVDPDAAQDCPAFEHR